MICPKDLKQMHQLDQIGGGESTDNSYETWEIKVCPICGRTVKEYYKVEVVTERQIAKYRKLSHHIE